MKKLVLYAITLIAFNVSSMANNLEEQLKLNPCKETFSWAFNSALANGVDADTAWATASFMYDMCEAGIDWSLVTP
ncbi:hypothetical protein OX284_004450 [Flavobacterium sp. SUN046]|uniref:hypothetical protein n=1 Tax=Flavobacterium sp. SUN046 TaxID=3002440 RepID=UPI002DBF937A|nr:hypothetical protein [Flavobacterium sp. SUN046]MEC4048670.1 hypothetical protein [Flavobacterium sp. SUN046]